MANSEVVEVVVQKSYSQIPVVSSRELLSLVEFYLDPFSLEPALAWYSFREGLLRSLGHAASGVHGGVVNIPLIGDFHLRTITNSVLHKQQSKEPAKPFLLDFKGWSSSSETSEMRSVDLELIRDQLREELLNRSCFWRRMPTQILREVEGALLAAESVILALRYFALHRRQAIELPGIGILSCTWQEEQSQKTSEGRLHQIGFVQFCFDFSPELIYALQERLLSPKSSSAYQAG